jgi:ribosomal protein S18 acetylase RimI-like enzyme
LALTRAGYEHPDAVRLIAELQAVYVARYGGGDETPLDPAEFAAPGGYFVLGYVNGSAVACGGWRAPDADPGDPDLRDGDAEIKRMYVAATYRGRGIARAVLAELERAAAAAGRRRMVLETGDRQPEAVALYTSSGYQPVPTFGSYRTEPGCRCFGKDIGHNVVFTS